MHIEKINDNNIDKIKSFINRVPTINQIDEDILKNAIILVDMNEIKGIISYEKYIDRGLIRYFIFQKDVPFEELKQMVEYMSECAKNNNIKSLLSVVEQKELIIFFSDLGFLPFSIDNIYIDEVSLGNTVYKKSQGMICYLE